MVWGGIFMEGRTGIYMLTAIRYRDEILGPIVRPYAGAVSPGFLEDEGIDTIDCTLCSPDLIPIEHL